ncbi:type II toxin-antitoxin system PemK/MazF family toxin [Neorhizobium petrolearium]|uniref:type II toxin-antitoxin system PemK/MazF family toxin n=1 Tax=Neorhizobium petrolearium TaxID=515361 RepID=UPI003F1783B1
MKRGEIVIVSAPGDYGKPRPAVVVQTNGIPENYPSIIVCQITSTIEAVTDFRIIVEPSERNGLRARSQIMTDKIIAVNQRRIGQRIGSLEEAELRQLNAALLFVLGLTD